MSAEARTAAALIFARLLHPDGRATELAGDQALVWTAGDTADVLLASSRSI